MLKMTHATREEATRLFLPLLLALERQKRTRARRVLLQRLAKGEEGGRKEGGREGGRVGGKHM